MKRLSELTAGLGKVASPYSEIISDENINEKIFVDVMKEILEQKNGDLWFQKRVDLWKLADRNVWAPDVLEDFEHPLQPDIDLFYCRVEDDQLMSPIVGVEVKLFIGRTGWGKVIPKTTGFEGFYAGLDEAISLLGFGLDYVYLWQVFLPPQTYWTEYLRRPGKKSREEFAYGYDQFLAAYSKEVKKNLLKLRIPIGYVATGLNIYNHLGCFDFYPLANHDARLNPYLNESATIRLRDLILRRFNIRETLSAVYKSVS